MFNSPASLVRLTAVACVTVILVGATGATSSASAASGDPASVPAVNIDIVDGGFTGQYAGINLQSAGSTTVTNVIAGVMDWAAYDAAGDLAYDPNGKIVLQPANGGAPRSLGDGAGQTYEPQFDAAGDLFYLAYASGPGQLWEVPAGGSASQLVTTPTLGLIPYGFAMDSTGDMFMTFASSDSGDPYQHTLVELPTGATTLTVIDSNLQGPTGIALDSGGNIYLADAGGGAVYEYAAGSHARTRLANIGAPFGVTADGYGNLYVAADSQVVELPAGPGGTVAPGTAPVVVSSGYAEARKVLVAPPTTPPPAATGDVLYSEFGAGVFRIPSGSSTAALLTGDGNYFADGLAVDSAGDFYTTENQGIDEYDANGTLIKTLYQAPSDGAVVDVALDNAGDLYFELEQFTSTNETTMMELPAGTATAVIVPNSSTVTNGATAIAVDFNDNVFRYVDTGSGPSTITEFPADGGTPDIVVTGANVGAGGLAVDSHDNIWTDFWNVVGPGIMEYPSGSTTPIDFSHAWTTTYSSEPQTDPLIGVTIAVDAAGDVFANANLLTDTVDSDGEDAFVATDGVWEKSVGSSQFLQINQVDPTLAEESNGEDAAATAVPRGLVAQAISFTGPSSGSVGSKATLSATGGPSGNPVVFTVDPSTTPGVCKLSGLEGATVKYSGVGSCVIDANQAGNTNDLPAPQVQQTIIVRKDQKIMFAGVSKKTLVQSPVTVNATASSGLPVAFTTTTPSVCTASGTTVTLIAAGTCTVTAAQNGNTIYNPAPSVSRSFTASKATQKITFAALAKKTLVQSPVTVSATASSGLPVAFTTTTPSVCTASGTTVTLIAAGTCTVTAAQNGNTIYNPAPSVSRSFKVT